MKIKFTGASWHRPATAGGRARGYRCRKATELTGA
jgi:hypothetical protein